MRKKKWIDDHREFRGRHMYRVNFKRFLQDRPMTTTVEQVARAIGYSVPGVVEMFKRGTIKVSVFSRLQRKFPDLVNYRTKKARK